MLSVFFCLPSAVFTKFPDLPGLSFIYRARSENLTDIFRCVARCFAAICRLSLRTFFLMPYGCIAPCLCHRLFHRISPCDIQMTVFMIFRTHLVFEQFLFPRCINICAKTSLDICPVFFFISLAGKLQQIMSGFFHRSAISRLFP